MFGKQNGATGIEHLDGLYAYALVLTCNRPEAEELVQETYIRARSTIRKLRRNSNGKKRLFTILRNVWLNQLGKRQSSLEFIGINGGDGILDGVVDSSKNSHGSYANRLETERVRMAIHKLPVTLREVILLRDYEELSYQEIATVLNRPVGTVISRWRRATTVLCELRRAEPRTSSSCHSRSGLTKSDYTN